MCSRLARWLVGMVVKNTLNKSLDYGVSGKLTGLTRRVLSMVAREEHAISKLVEHSRKLEKRAERPLCWKKHVINKLILS